MALSSRINQSHSNYTYSYTHEMFTLSLYIYHLSQALFCITFAFNSLSLSKNPLSLKNIVAMIKSSVVACFFFCVVVAYNPLLVLGRPATFLEDFRVTWSDSHLRQIDGGRAIQLVLDQNSGCGFASKRQYLFGRVSMKIKLIPGDSAGTVTAFYLNSDTDTVRDELDFEFLGNRTGQPYTVQTNIYAHGKGDREQRVNLWFDPAADFHTYTIMWNHHHIVFYVDEVPIRVYKNNEAKGIPYPLHQAMGVYSTLWEADDWATRGGLEKIDWTKAPFLAYYKDFDIEGCAVPGPANCAANPANWWEGSTYQSLNAIEYRRYKWVRINHMIYDYCTDRSRYPVPPPECLAGY